jgi:hypothetical protein
MRPGPYRWPQSRRSLPDCCFQVSKRYFKALSCPGSNGIPLDTAKFLPWIILSRSKKPSRAQSTLWRNWPPATTVNMVSPQDSEEAVRSIEFSELSSTFSNNYTLLGIQLPLAPNKRRSSKMPFWPTATQGSPLRCLTAKSSLRQSMIYSSRRTGFEPSCA